MLLQEREHPVLAVDLVLWIHGLGHPVRVQIQRIAVVQRHGRAIVGHRVHGTEEGPTHVLEPLPLAIVSEQRNVVAGIHICELARDPVENGRPHGNEHAGVVVLA